MKNLSLAALNFGIAALTGCQFNFWLGVGCSLAFAVEVIGNSIIDARYGRHGKD